MNKTVYSKNEIKDFINRLKKNEIGFFDIPKDLRTDKSIVDVERKLGLRRAYRRGYDVINDFFFVEEIITDAYSKEPTTKNIRTIFSDFGSYYLFLDGDIYENSCYYQFDFSVIKTKIDTEKISNKAFEETTIDDYSLELSKEERENYRQAEYTKTICKEWLEKFNVCGTYVELVKVVEDYKKSKISDIVDVNFFFFQYIFENVKDKNRFKVIMEYMSHGEYPSDRIIKSLCSIYDPEDVIVAYNYSAGSKQMMYKYKKKLRNYVESLNNEDMAFSKHCYFDSKTHYYCEELSNRLTSVRRYFESFESFITYRQGDLRDCDISNVVGLDFDLSDYRTDSTTKLPFDFSDELTYVERKSYEKEKFVVLQTWYDSNKNIIKNYKHTFDYFFDFVAFLKGDLSNADLLFCDGLKNLKDIKGLNLSGAMLTSELSEKFGIENENYDLNMGLIQSFVPIIKNEEETALSLQADREVILPLEECIKNQKIYYISDLHLMHRIKNADCKSKNDVAYVVGNVAKNIIKGISSDFLERQNRQLILIGGDTSSEFSIFALFVKILRRTLDDRRCKADIVFLLGNHELWGFPDEELTNIVSKYNSLIQEQGMYLLQNDILYKNADNQLNRITTNELLSSDKATIRRSLCDTRIVIFGGLAFSGYNEEFNAKDGIYRLTLDRQTEIEETQKFENLYDVVCETLSDKNLIVFTHTPQKDWSKNPKLQKNFVYVSGHTHRNCFYDDGEYRIYADNQVGYQNENPHMKYFYIENDFDYFLDYEDGIYEITADQYNDFYRGKNLQMNFTREINILYMLKKNGYYCFIHESKSGSLTILNGGELKKLKEKDIHYYYDNMDKVIKSIKKPLDAFTKFQEQISDEIKKIGGNGTIHGSIIDIDFYNHVYVNPIDMTVTGYWAQDIIFKKVYPNIPALLKEQCPELYDRYLKLLKGDKKNQVVIRGDVGNDLSICPDTYLDTNIYRASRKIKRMQKLNSNILSMWYEPNNNGMMIEERNSLIDN